MCGDTCLAHHVSMQTGSGKTYTMGTGFDVTLLPVEQGKSPPPPPPPPPPLSPPTPLPFPLPQAWYQEHSSTYLMVLMNGKRRPQSRESLPHSLTSLCSFWSCTTRRSKTCSTPSERRYVVHGCSPCLLLHVVLHCTCCVHVHTCVHVHNYVYMHVVYMYIHVYVHVYVHVHTCVRTCVHTCVHVYYRY